MSFFKFYTMNPVCSQNKQIERSVCNVNGDPLVLFHKNGNSLNPEVTSNFVKLVRSLNIGPVVELEENNWRWCKAEPRNFNCHALAIGSSVGLTPNDWLEGKASPATLHINPVELLLDNYFETVSERLVDNDVFLLKDAESNHFVHSGFVRWIDSRLVAVSKFGEGPILMTSLELIATVFRNNFNVIEWRRLSA